MPETKLINFGNSTAADKKLLKRFVNYHWELYKKEPRYIPLLDYEHLGLGLIGMTGWFEPKHLFYKHGKITFFIAERSNKVVGRVCAFINYNHNKHWNENIAFFGFFECEDSIKTAGLLLNACQNWAKQEGATSLRGPQNFPVNEATPGILTEGFNAVPVIYYHYNYPYYQNLLESLDYKVVKRVMGMDVPVKSPVEDKLLRVAERTKKKYNITLKSFNKKNLLALGKQMLYIYNKAWETNWGFVPMTEEEFLSNLEDMTLVWDPGMFYFAYVNGEPAAFFGSVPNIIEQMKPIKGLRRFELLRAAKMILNKGKVKGFRQGYFGILPEFRKIGLDAVLISEAKQYAQKAGYTYCDIGWVLEDNELIFRMAKFMGGSYSRTYTVYQKKI